MQDYRNELKFRCNRDSLFKLERRISSIMTPDSNQSNNGYTVRSAYFDGLFDECVHDNLAGVDRRDKYRVRIYDGDEKLIKAEIKTHIRGKIKKQATTIDRTQYEKLLDRVHTSDLIGKSEGLDKYVEVIMTRMYQPKVVVEYDRTAYVYQPCDVRVTFDRNIRASCDTSRFFEKNIDAIPILDSEEDILEVKYNEFLPDHVGLLLQGAGLEKTSFSKYAISRLRMNNINWEKIS